MHVYFMQSKLRLGHQHRQPYTLKQCLRCALSGWLRSRTRSIISYTHLSHRLHLHIIIVFISVCMHTQNRLAISKINCFHGHVCVWMINMNTMSIVLYIAAERYIVDGVCGRWSPALAPRYTYIYITSLVCSRTQYYILQHRAVFNSLYTSLN